MTTEGEQRGVVTDEAYVTWPRLLTLLAIIFAPLAATSGYGVALAIDATTAALAARPDPFTGTEARAMEAKLIQRDRDLSDQLRRECEARLHAIQYAMTEMRTELRSLKGGKRQEATP